MTSHIPTTEQRDALVKEVLENMRGITQIFHRRFREPRDPDIFDLTMPQCRIVLFLSEAPANMSKIAASLGISLPSATGVVDRLAERNLISRRENPDDRRLVICSLTEQGRKMADSLYEADAETLGSLVRALSPEEIQVVLEATRLLIASAHHQNESPEQDQAIP